MSLSSLPQKLFPTIYKIYFLLENYFFDFCINWSRILLQCICSRVFVALKVGKKLTENNVSVVPDSENM